MSSGSSRRQPWSIVARCDPTDGEIITAHDGAVQILITFFGADVLRQRSKIVAAVKQAAGSDLDNKFLERVLEAANTSVRAARPFNSNQGASIAIAYQDANYGLTSLALGKCQVWLSRGGALESTNAYPDIYLGESGLNAGRRLAPEKLGVELAQTQRAVLAPVGYNLSARPVRPSWLTLLAIVVLVGVGWLGMPGVWPPSSPLAPTRVALQSDVPPSLQTLTLEATPIVVVELPPTTTPSFAATTTVMPAPTTPIPIPLPAATPTATFTPVASQSPELGVSAGVGITPTITLADIMPRVGSYDNLNFDWAQSGDLADPYLLEVVIWLDGPGAETPSTDLNCFLTANCGKGISAPEKRPPQNVPLEEVSKRTNMAGLLIRGNRYRWTVFVVIPDDPETSTNEYRRIVPVNLAGFNGDYPEFEFSRPSDDEEPSDDDGVPDGIGTPDSSLSRTMP